VRDALAAGASETGTTIHWVDEGVDTGEIIAQEPIEILPTDTEETLHERIKIIERGLIVATIPQVLAGLK
jgi:phosphoribosylglycinamide formyltransferase-1